MQIELQLWKEMFNWLNESEEKEIKALFYILLICFESETRTFSVILEIINLVVCDFHFYDNFQNITFKIQENDKHQIEKHVICSIDKVS
jgi:hypothetical protein